MRTPPKSKMRVVMEGMGDILVEDGRRACCVLRIAWRVERGAMWILAAQFAVSFSIWLIFCALSFPMSLA